MTADPLKFGDKLPWNPAYADKPGSLIGNCDETCGECKHSRNIENGESGKSEWVCDLVYKRGFFKKIDLETIACSQFKEDKYVKSKKS
jgi:hypothetical protein